MSGPESETTFRGIVLDTENRPIPGATAQFKGVMPPVQAFSDDQGVFALSNVPIGSQHLVVDGATSTRPGPWPHLEFAVQILSGIENSLGRPVYLPQLDSNLFRLVGGDEDVILRMEGVEGFSLKVFAHSTTFPDGSPTGILGVTQVSNDQVPMPPMGGAAPPWVGTLQPRNVILNPPAQMTVPNALGLAPGQIVTLFSFDHDLNQYVSVGTGTVQPNGATIVSDPGSGIRKSGWFFDCPPPPPPDCTCSCDDADDCTTDNCSGPPDCSCSHEDDPNCEECNGVRYNPATQGCCDDTVVYNLATEGCCDDIVYSLATQGCCEIGAGPFSNDTVYTLATECCEDPPIGPNQVVNKNPITFGVIALGMCSGRVQNPSWVFQFDGCSLPISPGFDKDNPAGGADTHFGGIGSGPCDLHDICYQTCSTASNARLLCDQGMLNGMRAVCLASAEPPSVVASCLIWADVYFAGLRSGGLFAFDGRQREVCNCCP
jgi:hypothetical protein